MENLPGPVGDYVAAQARALDCDPVSVALPVLSALAAAIGKSRRIRLKRSWTEPCVLWTAVIGNHGLRPMLDAATQPLQEIQQQAFPQFRQAVVEHDYELARHTYDRERIRSRGQIPHQPEEPGLQQCLTGDWNLPSLLKSLPHQLGGTLLSTEELDGWIGTTNRIGSRRAAELSTWHDLHGGNPLVVTPGRNKPAVQVTDPAVSVTGMILPETLQARLTTSPVPCGLVSRLLFAMPRSQPRRWTDDDVEPPVSDGYAGVVKRLMSLLPDQIDQAGVKEEEVVVDDGGIQDQSWQPLSVSGELDRDRFNRFLDSYAAAREPFQAPAPVLVRPQRLVPALVDLSPSANELLAEFMNEVASDQPGRDEALAPWLAHLPGHAARLALVLHLSRWAAGEQVDPAICDETSMQHGLNLATWFAMEAFRIVEQMSLYAFEREQFRVADWIMRRGGVVSARDLNRSNSRKYPTAGQAWEMLDSLVANGVGRWVQYPAGDKGGRPFQAFSLGPGFDGNLPQDDQATWTARSHTAAPLNAPTSNARTSSRQNPACKDERKSDGLGILDLVRQALERRNKSQQGNSGRDAETR